MDNLGHAEEGPWHFVEGRGVVLSAPGRAAIGLEVAEAESGDGGRLAIPESALLRTVRGDFVYVENGGYFFRSPVTIGGRSADAVEVVEGLFEGDMVASAGARMLWLTELQSINGGASCAHSH